MAYTSTGLLSMWLLATSASGLLSRSKRQRSATKLTRWCLPSLSSVPNRREIGSSDTSVGSRKTVCPPRVGSVGPPLVKYTSPPRTKTPCGPIALDPFTGAKEARCLTTRSCWSLPCFLNTRVTAPVAPVQAKPSALSKHDFDVA